MGKLKEKLLNNLSEEELNQKMMGDISAFEYVEYMERYKSEEEFPQPTEEEIVEMEAMIKEYYESDEYKREMAEINQLMELKYSDSDILAALDSILPLSEPHSKSIRDSIMFELNQMHNYKMGYLD
jgi:hypothetical protein